MAVNAHCSSLFFLKQCKQWNAESTFCQNAVGPWRENSRSKSCRHKSRSAYQLLAGVGNASRVPLWRRAMWSGKKGRCEVLEGPLWRRADFHCEECERRSGETSCELFLVAMRETLSGEACSATYHAEILFVVWHCYFADDSSENVTLVKEGRATVAILLTTRSLESSAK